MQLVVRAREAERTGCPTAGRAWGRYEIGWEEGLISKIIIAGFCFVDLHRFFVGQDITSALRRIVSSRTYIHAVTLLVFERTQASVQEGSTRQDALMVLHRGCVSTPRSKEKK